MILLIALLCITFKALNSLFKKIGLPNNTHNPNEVLQVIYTVFMWIEYIKSVVHDTNYFKC